MQRHLLLAGTEATRARTGYDWRLRASTVVLRAESKNAEECRFENVVLRCFQEIAGFENSFLIISDSLLFFAGHKTTSAYTSCPSRHETLTLSYQRLVWFWN